MKENDTKTIERKISALNLGSKFDAVVETKYAGGNQIWKNPIRGPMSTWHNIDKEIKSGYKPFTPDELFGKDYGPRTVHNLSMKGKKIRQLGVGAHLTAEGWKFLFKEVFEESTKLSGSID
jgi:hypothetical protein